MPYKAATLKPLVVHRPSPRLSAKERGYDRDHRAWRKAVLARYPICAKCGINPATHADHRIPHRGNDALRLDTANGQGLCHGCHSVKTAARDGGFGNPRR